MDGCIWLTEEQASNMLDNLKRQLNKDDDMNAAQTTTEESHERQKRSLMDFVSYPDAKWQLYNDMPIPFMYDGKHS